MKTGLVLACAAAGLTLLPTSGYASADTYNPTMEITADAFFPGSTVSISATCDHPGFEGVGHTESYFLEPAELTGEKDADGVWHLSGTSRVHADAKPGPASALFGCGPDGSVGVGEFVITAPPTADYYAAIGIDDREIRPGQEVRVSASCQNPGFVSSPVRSDVVTAPDLRRVQAVDSPMFAMGTVAADARSGEHTISFTCVDREVTGTFIVTGAAKSPGPAGKAQVPVKPKGAAETGALAEPASGPDATALVLGGGALLAAGGVGAWAYRRRGQS